MSLMQFLKSSKVEELKPGVGGNRTGNKKQWNPPAMMVAIRLWKDGSVFPSLAARDKFDLEYKKTNVTKEALKMKEGETEQKYRRSYDFPNGAGNGFDFIDSRLWNQATGEGSMILVATVPKNAGKVDLFNTVAYDDEGTPKVSVMEQGAASFGADVMIPAIEAVYGIRFNRSAKEADGDEPAVTEVTDGVDFVDLAIVEKLRENGEEFDISAHFTKPIINTPKQVVRGTNKGKPDYTRRENVTVYGLIPAETAVPGYKAEEEAPVEASPSTEAGAGSTASNTQE